MGSIDLLCYAQPILAAIGIIGVLHYCFKFYHFLFPNGNEVTEFTKSQISAEDETINIQQTEPMYRDTIATDDGSRKKLQCGAYSIGIITALPNEMKAAISILDEEHRPPSDFCRPRDDYNPYVWGSMSTRSEESHNVVIASFPAKRPGTVTAADVARLMVTAFPSIRLGLMVGIGGGVPGPNDIRLGDVVVSQGSGTTGGVVQYDFGKEEEEGFRRQGQTDSPPVALLSAITAFEARDPASSLNRAVMTASSKIQKTYLNLGNRPTYSYQGVQKDRLFQSRYHGPGAAQWPIFCSLFRSPQGSQLTHNDCARCNPRMLVKRDPRPSQGIPRIHYGLIASGNRVIRNAETRDKIVASLKQDTNNGDCLCFEMEAAGLMNNFPCLVIRGISDYADAHKNNMWHNYAALTAAAYARELLRVLSTAEVSSSKPAREIFGQIRRDVKSLRADLQKISDEQIRDWLEPSEQQNNFDQAQDEIERYQTESTWFFEHEDYRDWASHKIHHIWLHGQSGCGKTVLASTMVKQLSAERKLSLYFFFDFRDTKKQSLESLLRSLIWQLFSLSDSEDVKTLVRQLYEDRKFPTPTIEKLKHTFDKIVEEMDEVQVVLDALDESTRKGTDRDELLRWLKPRTQYEGPGVYKLRTIITSQSDQQDIMNVLGSSSVGKREIRIENETAKVKETIHQYIHKRLSNDGGFAEWRKPPNKSLLLDPESQEQGGMDNWHPIMKEMEQCLVDKAGLMFRWASLTIDSLGKMGTIQKIKRALESLPEGLDEIYTRSLEETKPHESEAIRILQLLLFSSKSLTEQNVLDATSVDLEAPPGCGIDPRKRVNSFDKLSSLMSTFIRKTETTGELHISHSSVRDYLLYTDSGCPPWHKFREIPAKAAVVGVCLGYIDSFLTHSTPSSDPETCRRSFLMRASKIWRELSRERSVQKEACSSILKFLIHNGSKLQNRTSHYLYQKYGGPPLYVASAMSLSLIVGILLDAGVKADEKGEIDGFSEAVALPNSFYERLLDHFGIEKHEEVKNDEQWSSSRYGNALVAACTNGDDSIVRMLLDSKADANAYDGSSYGSPLYISCLNKYEGIVEMLLNKGADVNQRVKRFGTPLSAACKTGSVESLANAYGHVYASVASKIGVVKLLLDKGADVNVGNPLFSACVLGIPEIVNLLLDKGADANIGNPLFAACESWRLDIVKLLLENGADPDAPQDDRRSALGAACLSGNEDIVRVLLANGADANADRDYHGDPLQHACCRDEEKEAIVKMLLEHGADVNAKRGRHGTALYAAVKRGHNRSVKLLLNAGADIHVEHGGRTILEAACFSKSEETFQLLLEAGANPNDPSPGRGKLLQLAASRKQQHIVRYLLETRVDLDDLDWLTQQQRQYIPYGSRIR